MFKKNHHPTIIIIIETRQIVIWGTYITLINFQFLSITCNNQSILSFKIAVFGGLYRVFNKIK